MKSHIDPIKALDTIPVITIDGTSGVGKGTIARLLANFLKWHLLDSGCLYRALALMIEQKGYNVHQEEEITQLAYHLPLNFAISKDNSKLKIFLRNLDITYAIREEKYSDLASKIAVYPRVRAALLHFQHEMKKQPGLVADGRDMGTVVFKEAPLKFFLDATAIARAQRRYLQLKEQHLHVSLSSILEDVIDRDFRDRHREVAPLKPATDAIVIDTTDLSASEVFSIVKMHARQSGYGLE